MKVNEYITKSNEKKSVSPQRLQELKQYYVAMYRYYMLKLYELGYIDDPTVFDKKQITKNFIDLGVTGISDSGGRVSLSHEWVDYLCCRKSNEGALEFLTLLRDATKYRGYSHDLDILYEECYQSKSVRMSFRLSGSKVDLLRLKATKGSLQALVGTGKTLYSIPIKDFIWDLGMRQLGISEEDWHEDGIMCKELSHSDEVKFIQLIFEGRLVPDGKYGDILSDWLLSHRWSKGSDNIVTQKGLLGYLHFSKYSEINEEWQRVINQLESEDKNIICLMNNEIFVERDIQNYKIPVSMFAIFCDNGEDLMVDKSNALTGYLGEAYSSDYLREEGIDYVGLPIKLVDDDVDELTLYDREQTNLKDETWFKANDVDFFFEEVRFRNPFKRTSQPLHYELFEIYKQAQNGELGSVSLSEYTIKEINSAKKRVTQAILKL